MYDQEAAEPDLITEASYPESMVLVCAPHYTLAQKQEIVPNDLTDETLIISESGCSYRDLLEDMMMREKARFRSIISMSSLQAEKQFTTNGFGVCLLAKNAVKEDLAKGRLIALPWKGPEFHISTQIVYHKDK
ncbi:MAG: substrate-binding domain-containing protein [Flexilinea sp.]